MYTDLKDKTALVSGAGKQAGIGYAAARKLAGSGANVLLADMFEQRDQSNPLVTTSENEISELTAAIRSDFGVRAEYCHLDVTDADSISGMGLCFCCIVMEFRAGQLTLVLMIILIRIPSGLQTVLLK